MPKNNNKLTDNISIWLYGALRPYSEIQVKSNVIRGLRGYDWPDHHVPLYSMLLHSMQTAVTRTGATTGRAVE